MSAATITLDEQEFRKWLLRYKPSTPVGNKDRCPLVRFLGQRLHEPVFVNDDTFGLMDRDGEWDTPAWASAFVNWADRFGSGSQQLRTAEGWEDITAADALAALTQSAPSRGEGEPQP
jgi:isopentenyl diphosphate isomerase/L-lactate dehydrogenase-like FMN-dependent dehydrogenase